MLLITSLFFLYCNRFWWWILWPPGFFSAIPFLGFVFDFFQVCHPKTRCSPHTEISLCIFVFSQLLFDIPHLFVALAWYKRSKRTAAKHSQRQWARLRAKRPTSGAASVGGPGIPIQSCINCTKSKSNEIISEIRDKTTRAIVYIYNI